MIEPLEGFPENVLAFAGKGHLTKQDYDTVLVPSVEKALEHHAKLRLYYELGSDFTGVDPGAAWEDFKLGVEHLTRWERIALVTDVDWIKHAMKLFSFVMPGDVKVFSTSEAGKARGWIAAGTEESRTASHG